MAEAARPVARSVAERLGSVAVVLFRTALWCHAALAAAQPFSAGVMLEASVGARTLHAGAGGFLLLVAMAQIPLAVLAWFPGRWPLWPAGVAVLLFIAVTAQTAFGRSGALAIHLPLGVAIVAVALGLAIWSLRPRHRPRRRAGLPAVARDAVPRPSAPGTRPQ